MKISLDKVEKVHFIGICGIGISAIARLLKTAGKEVSGSDVKSTLICDNFKKAFNEVVGNLPHNGILICNGDDTNIKYFNSEIDIQDISCTANKQNPSNGGNDGRIL